MNMSMCEKYTNCVGCPLYENRHLYWETYVCASVSECAQLCEEIYEVKSKLGIILDIEKPETKETDK